jgi:hypothetical protein
MAENQNSDFNEAEKFKVRFLRDFVKLIIQNTKPYYIMQLEMMTQNQKEEKIEFQTKTHLYG